MKKRLDIILIEKGFFTSREQAKTMVMAGCIFVNNQRVDKPGFAISDNDKIEVKGEKLKYVSRGGLKLEKAINNFNINLNNKICMDVGASTGGFTDCMLQNGAQKVYAVDVGYGQLAWSLRTNKKVINMERTNIRYIDQHNIDDIIDFISVDVSFISLKLVLPVLKKILKLNGKMVCLIKPQFEAGKDKIGKNGVVRDKLIHKQVINNIINFIQVEVEFDVLNLDYSPIKGPKGNIEYLIYLKNSCENKFNFNLINDVVEQSHKDL